MLCLFSLILVLLIIGAIVNIRNTKIQSRHQTVFLYTAPLLHFYTPNGYSTVLVHLKVQYTSHYRTLALNVVQDPVADRLREREKQRERLLAQISDKQLYSLQRTASYSALLHTAPPVSAPFYVISASALGIAGLDDKGAQTLFEERYPSGTRARVEVEERIEAEYSALVAYLCAGERDRRMTLVQCDLELEFIVTWYFVSTSYRQTVQCIACTVLWFYSGP